MVVQWLAFCNSTAVTEGSIRGCGIKIPHALQGVKKNLKKKWGPMTIETSIFHLLILICGTHCQESDG